MSKLPEQTDMDEMISSYEHLFAERFGVCAAFSFWKGRVALYAILKALGVQAGDDVIVPGYTCVMNVNPIKYLGARPVYADIEPVTFNIDSTLLREKITPKTKLIIAQHTYGYPCDMDAVMRIAGDNGIEVIEDCCLALGSQYRGKMVGTFGKAAYFSFQWNKPYTTGLGGMAITDDRELAGRIELLRESEMVMPSETEALMLWVQALVYRMAVYPRTTALIQEVFRYLTKRGVVVGSSGESEFRPVMTADFFKGMGAVQARRGIRQLRRLERNIAHRRKMSRLYDELLAAKGWRPRGYDRSAMDPVMVRYPVRITEKDRALSEAGKAGVEIGSWFECPLHPKETPLAAYDYEIGMCPHGEKASREVVNLPLHPRTSEATIRRTVEFIAKFTQAR